METNHRKLKVYGLLFVAFICYLILAFMEPIKQDPNYHTFADERTYMSIANFWNVISNIPYIIVGILGFLFLLSEKGKRQIPELRINYFCFFLGVFATGFGSAWYHWNPTTPTLVWDRLPMTFTFMSFVTVIIGEYISVRWSKLLLLPLLALGVFSVLYWIYTEEQCCGDLRCYAFVQFAPMLIIPLILVFFNPLRRPIKYVWLVLLCYLIAKFFEAGDKVIFEHTGISGHTLKHFAAGATPFFLWLGLRRNN